MVKLLEKQKTEFLNCVLQIYRGKLKTDSGEGNCDLILTYPLAQRLGMSFSDQYLFYAFVMDIFAHNKIIHLKPHPDDKGDYSLFEGVEIIPKTVLAELLWFVTRTKYDKAITAVSTSMGALKNYDEGLIFPREFVEEKGNLFLYYVASLIVKSIMETSVEVILEYSSALLKKIFPFFLNQHIYGMNDVYCRTWDKVGKIQITHTGEKMIFDISSPKSANEIVKEKAEYGVLVYGNINFEYRLVIEADCKFELESDTIFCKNSKVYIQIEKREKCVADSSIADFEEVKRGENNEDCSICPY